ncbi:MAG: carbohydrate kinase family protein [Candidatus Yanofskybacteria bacterium]|nr:carbohydrate kinase family protein [Candidatus Yanofskybacteria bacterium]
MNYDVIAIGSATQDVFFSADAFRVLDDDQSPTRKGLCVPFGSKVPVKKIVFASGGGGTNAAVTFARQGYRAACIGVIGKDPNGAAILDELRRERVDGKYMMAGDDDITAYSSILVGDGGERTILSYKGEGLHWHPEHIPWDRLSAKWVYVNSLGGSIEMLERIAAFAQRTGAHVATNPGPGELAHGLAVLAPLWKSFDIVGMNQEEAAQLTGKSFDDPDAIFAALDDAIGGICSMTNGPRGVAVSDGRMRYTAGTPEGSTIERTGAGDAFHAGFLAEFIRSGSIEKAIQFGTANATSVVMQYGAKAGILRVGDIGSWPLVPVVRTSVGAR